MTAIMVVISAGITSASPEDSDQHVCAAESLINQMTILSPGEDLFVTREGLTDRIRGDGRTFATLVDGKTAHFWREGTEEPAVGVIPEGLALVVFKLDGEQSFTYGCGEHFGVTLVVP